MELKLVKKGVNVVSMLSLVACVILCIYAYQNQLFTSITALQEYISQFGHWAPIIFILLQIIQVVIPIIPGGLGCLAGVLLFGPVFGFVYNYIGICIGSFIIFGISKIYGRTVIEGMFSESLIQKYDSWTNNESHFSKWFSAAIFFPVAPDDFLCYLAGTTKMLWRKYIVIILLGKPVSILLYSLGLNLSFSFISSLF